GAGVSVLDQADHPCPARIPIDELRVDPVPTEVPDGDPRDAGFGRSFERQRGNVGDHEPDVVSAKERDLARDELRSARVDPLDAFERGRHVGADRVELDHADVERAGAETVCARRQAAEKETRGEVARDQDRKAGPEPVERAQDVAGSGAVAIAMRAHVVGKRSRKIHFSQIPSGIGLASTTSTATPPGASTKKLFRRYSSLKRIGSTIRAPALFMRS